MLWGKGGSGRSYPGVAVAAASAVATTGSLLLATPGGRGPRRRKKSLRGASKPALGEPSLPGGRESRPLPWIWPPSPESLTSRYLGGPRESKHMGAGKKFMVRRVGQVVSTLAMAGEDNNPNRDPFPKAQLTTDRPWPSSPSVPHGESGRANLNIRDTQDSGNSEPVAMNKGEVMPRGPGPS
ncbi:hypothetical protein Celaphus_00009851, partial [Cervus elaphus hippelaphus]